MKKMNFILKMVSIIALSCMLACTGEDGAIGPVGEDGTDGIDGTDGFDGEDGTDGLDGQDGTDGEGGSDGEDGEDGEDGNANVSTYIYDVSDKAGSFMDISVPPVTESVIENDVVLSYLTAFSGASKYSIPIPGIGPNEAFLIYVRLFSSADFTSNYTVDFDGFDGTAYAITAGTFDELKVIIIESTSTTNGRSVFNRESVLDELEAAGVDADNYDEVVAYYNL